MSRDPPQAFFQHVNVLVGGGEGGGGTGKVPRREKTRVGGQQIRCGRTGKRAKQGEQGEQGEQASEERNKGLAT